MISLHQFPDHQAPGIGDVGPVAAHAVALQPAHGGLEVLDQVLHAGFGVQPFLADSQAYSVEGAGVLQDHAVHREDLGLLAGGALGHLQTLLFQKIADPFEGLLEALELGLNLLAADRPGGNHIGGRLHYMGRRHGQARRHGDAADCPHSGHREPPGGCGPEGGLGVRPRCPRLAPCGPTEKPAPARAPAVRAVVGRGGPFAGLPQARAVQVPKRCQGRAPAGGALVNVRSRWGKGSLEARVTRQRSTHAD